VDEDEIKEKFSSSIFHSLSVLLHKGRREGRREGEEKARRMSRSDFFEQEISGLLKEGEKPLVNAFTEKKVGSGRVGRLFLTNQRLFWVEEGKIQIVWEASHSNIEGLSSCLLSLSRGVWSKDEKERECVYECEYVC